MRLLLSAVFLPFLWGCSSPQTNIEGVNWEVWKNDRGACNNRRAQFHESLAAQKDKLKALSEMEIVRLLGKPDQNELYKRNQKFYYYFLTPGPDCAQPDSAARQLIVRFNAIGLAKEISIE